MVKQKIYISGKITGLDLKEARAKFARDERMLKGQGYEVVNPMKITGDNGLTWRECMCDCLEALFYCDAIYMQPDWGASKGARVEYVVARELDLRVLYGSFINE